MGYQFYEESACLWNLDISADLPGENHTIPVSCNIDWFDGEGRGTIREEARFRLIRMYNLGKLGDTKDITLLTEDNLTLKTTGDRIDWKENYNNQPILVNIGRI